MKDIIKTAANSLYAKNKITKQERDMLVKTARSNLFRNSFGSSVFKYIKNISAVNPLVPVVAAGAAIMAAKEGVIDPVVQAVGIGKSYKTMIKKVPQLAEKDQGQVKDYFNVVRMFSPKAASSPLVAGHLVNKMIEFGGVDHKLVQDIASIQAGIAVPRILPSTAEAAVKSMVSLPKGES